MTVPFMAAALACISLAPALAKAPSPSPAPAATDTPAAVVTAPAAAQPSGPPASHDFNDDIAYAKAACSGDARYHCFGAGLIVAPSKPQKQEFRASTRVLFFDRNGVDVVQAIVDAEDLANQIGGPVEVYYTYSNGNDRTFAPADAIALTGFVKSNLAAGTAMHMVGFRSGATLIAAALTFADNDLVRASSAADAAAKMKLVGVETFDAPKADFPPGVRSAQYVEPGQKPIVNGF